MRAISVVALHTLFWFSLTHEHILLRSVVIIAMLAISRNNKSGQEKDMLLYDEDDVRDGLQPYHDEGGGEEDNVSVNFCVSVGFIASQSLFTAT